MLCQLPTWLAGADLWPKAMILIIDSVELFALRTCLYRNMFKMYFLFRTGQDPLDNQEIKSAVQNYGAVFTSMYYD